nr:cytochrome c [Lysobacter capsici]
MAAPATAQDAAAGAKLYADNCSACHGPDRAGIAGTFPALTDVTKRLDPKQIKEKIQKGGGLMPPFGQLSPKDVEDIAAFLKQ